MKITELKNNLAVQIDDFDIKDITPENAKKINDITKDRTVVVIKKQDRTSATFAHFVSLLGPICNWTQFNFDPVTGEEIYKDSDLRDQGFIEPKKWDNPNTYPVQRVSQQKIKGKRAGIFNEGILDWHGNLNGLKRADCVALQGIQYCEKTSTTYLNTVKVLEEMPEDLKQRCQDVCAEYCYTPKNWAPGLPQERSDYMAKVRPDMNHFPTPYRMWLIQENIAGKRGIYFYTNNDCKIITNDSKLYDDLYDFTFQEKYMYQHFYEVGDIVLCDQLLSLHKRDQNDPELLAKRALHRITYRLSNIDVNNPWIEKYNKGCSIEETEPVQ